MGNTSGGHAQQEDKFCICMISEVNKNNENAKWIFCHGCNNWFHTECVLLSDSEFDIIMKTDEKWFCHDYRCQTKKAELSQFQLTETENLITNNEEINENRNVSNENCTDSIRSKLPRKCNQRKKKNISHERSLHLDQENEQPSTQSNSSDILVSKCTFCGYLAKNDRGLKIHYARGCNKIKTDSQTQCPISQNNDFNKKHTVIDNNQITFVCKKCPTENQKSFHSLRGLRIHISKCHPNSSNFHDDIDISENSDETDFEKVFELKSKIGVLKRIPKSARRLAARSYTNIVKDCMSKNDIESWLKFFTFSYKAFHVPKKTKKEKSRSLASKVKENLLSDEGPPVQKEKFKSANFYKRIEAKVADFDVKGAVKLISSDDTFAPYNIETIEQLKSKHPEPSRPLSFPAPPKEDDPSLTVTSSEVHLSIMSFASGSAAGPDGFRPQFFKDITSISAGKEGVEALSSITDLSNFMLQGKVNETVCKYLYGAALCALNKKDGGIRPIAIGLSSRRLVSKLACRHANEVIGEHFRGTQTGFGVKQGCEATIHATRAFLSDQCNFGKVCLKIDYKNAFNSCERDVMLKEVKEKTPLLYKYFWQTYANPTVLIYHSNVIASLVGAQQGDPAGPFLFSLSIQPIINELKSVFNVWYLDDGTFSDDPETVLNDFSTLIRMSKEIGLEINPSKCEVFFCSGVVDNNILLKFQDLAPGIKVITKENFQLLGSAIFEEGFDNIAIKSLAKMDKMFERLKNLKAHTALFLLRHCFGIPKLTSLIRSFPIWKYGKFMDDVDNKIKVILEVILNVQLENQSYIQAVLPINFGGLGVRRLNDIALPAYLSSLYGAGNLISQLLHNSDEIVLQHKESALQQWNAINVSIPSMLASQRHWDHINIKRIIETDLNFNDIIAIARFKALQCKESNSWLKAIPSPNIGTFLDDNTLRICIGLRLGSQLCRPHTCKCGSSVSSLGLHGLSCQKSAGRYPTHYTLNDIIQRSLSTIHIPSKMEPDGLSNKDDKRPDGVTLLPWSRGKMLAWDSTCTDTFANSYIHGSAKIARSAAENADYLKHKKHNYINSNAYIFLAFAVETMGPFSKDALNFINKLGSISNEITGDIRSKEYIFQRISLAIQRGNALRIMGTLPDSECLEEVFYL